MQSGKTDLFQTPVPHVRKSSGITALEDSGTFSIMFPKTEILLEQSEYMC